MFFVSYAREDRDFADRVAAEIDDKLGIEVWTDRRLQAGGRYEQDIRQALERALVVIVLWSRESVRSDYVLDEAGIALDANKLLPVRIDDVKPPLGFGRLHTLDLLRGSDARSWDAAALIDELLRWVPRHVDIPWLLRLDAQQSAELELARRLMQQRRVTLVCGSAESLAGHLFARGLSLLGLRCSSEDEPREASGAEMLPRLQAIGESDLCVVLLYPTSLSGWYFEALPQCRRGPRLLSGVRQHLARPGAARLPVPGRRRAAALPYRPAEHGVAVARWAGRYLGDAALPDAPAAGASAASRDPVIPA